MTKSTSGLNLLRASGVEAGTEVVVQSTSSMMQSDRIAAYVDEDGIVRQAENGAAFNGDSYEVVN